MPIRTHRGRAAVYRRLWGWPLRSPKHLLAAVVLFGGLATGIGLLLPEPQLNSPQQRGSEQATTEVPNDDAIAAERRAAKAPPTISVPQAGPAPAAPSPEGLAAAEAWGRAWVDHPPGTDSQQWLQRLRPYTTDEFITVMSSVDPANVPSTEVSGPAAPLESTSGSMDVRLPTNAGDLEILVIRTGQGWKVADYTKVD